ncbi:MAG: DsbA family protein [Oceanicaulis sp.]
MRRLIAALAFSFAIAACSGADDASAQADRVDVRDRAEIEAVVRAYILENPEIIEEALIELQMRARQRERQALAQAVASQAERVYEDPRDPVLGAADAPITVVEFFDYRCPYCTLTNDWVQSVLEDHGDQVRFVFKEYPVNGETSTEAARAALAVWRLQPDLYAAFHDGMMTASGPLPSERINEIAADLGVDVAAMRAEMDAEEITAHLVDTRALARSIGRVGTPFFVIDGKAVNGADLNALDRLLGEALQQAG